MDCASGLVGHSPAVAVEINPQNSKHTTFTFMISNYKSFGTSSDTSTDITTSSTSLNFSSLAVSITFLSTYFWIYHFTYPTLAIMSIQNDNRYLSDISYKHSTGELN